MSVTVILVRKRNFKIVTVTIPKYKKWKGYISSDRISVTVILVPIKKVEQLYLFRFKKRNSFIFSGRYGGIVIFVPARKVEQLYLFQSILNETVRYICSNRPLVKLLYSIPLYTV